MKPVDSDARSNYILVVRAGTRPNSYKLLQLLGGVTVQGCKAEAESRPATCQASW